MKALWRIFVILVVAGLVVGVVLWIGQGQDISAGNQGSNSGNEFNPSGHDDFDLETEDHGFSGGGGGGHGKGQNRNDGTGLNLEIHTDPATSFSIIGFLKILLPIVLIILVFNLLRSVIKASKKKVKPNAA